MSLNHLQKNQIPLEKSHRILSPRMAFIVTTLDSSGTTNAGVFSNVTSVSTDPERLVVGIYKEWDTLKNIEASDEFVVNVPTSDWLDEVWICGDKYAGNPIPAGISELEIAGLTEIPSEVVSPPRIKECAGHLECKKVWLQDVGNHMLLLGEIVCGSYSEGFFDEDLIHRCDKTQPVMEISSGFFTTAGKITEVNRQTLTSRVDAKLEEQGIEISDELQYYKENVISLNKDS